MEELERRVLLGADIPGVTLPWDLVTNQGNAEVLNISPTTGTASFSSDIGFVNDDDLFSFIAPADRYVSVLVSTNGLGSTLLPSFVVFNTAGTRIATGWQDYDLNNLSDAPRNTGLNVAGIGDVLPTDSLGGWNAIGGEQYFIAVTGVIDAMGNATIGDYNILVKIDAFGTDTEFNSVTPVALPADNVINSFQARSTIANPGEIDEYTFVAPANDFVKVLADTVTLGGSLNTAVEVRDSTGAIVAAGNNNGLLSTGLARDGWAGFVATAGETYTIRVRGENNTTGAYTLRVDAHTRSLVIFTDEDVGNMNDRAADAGLFGESIFTVTDPGGPEDGNAARLPLFPIPGAPVYQRDIVRFRQDEVIYRAEVPAGDDRFDSLATFVLSATLSDVDPHIEVYDAQGNLIVSDIQSAFLNNPFAAFKSAPGSTFFLRIRSDDLGNTFTRPSASTQLTALPIGQVRPDANNVYLQPAPLIVSQLTGIQIRADFAAADIQIRAVAPRVNEPITAAEELTFRSANDTSMFTFIAEGTGLTFITAVGQGLPAPDTSIRLYDSEGNFLAFSDDFQGSNNSEIQIRLTGGDRYFVVVDTFAQGIAGGLGLQIEAHHTFDPTIFNDPRLPALVSVDDHVNTPALDGSLPFEEVRRNFELATPLIWGDPFLLTDSFGNPVRDRGWLVQAQARGRIHGAGDTDLFMFHAPVDMLGDYAGQNDGAGTSLFVGGRFDTLDANSQIPVNQRVGVWDATDWYFTGTQTADDAPVRIGFFDNPATAGTDGPEIYVMQEIELGGVPALIIGGDFQYEDPINGFIATNLIGYAFNPLAGRYEYFEFISTDLPVRAMTVFTPEAFDPDGDGPAPEIPVPPGIEDLLIIGGEFTNFGGAASSSLVALDLNTGAAFDIGAQGGLTGSVFALASYSPEDAGDSGEIPMGATSRDPFDPPNMLFVGGQFTVNAVSNAGVAANTNLAAWTGQLFGNGFNNNFLGRIGDTAGLVMGNFEFTGFTNAAPSLSVTGGVDPGVFSLIVYDPTEPDGVEDFGPVLVVGGRFTTISSVDQNTGAANTVTANGLAMLGRVSAVDVDPDPDAEFLISPHLVFEPLSTDPFTPDGLVETTGTVFAMAVWDIPGEQIEGEVLLIGGDFADLGDNLIAWNGEFIGSAAAFLAFSAGPGLIPGDEGFFNGPVRAIAVYSDADEPWLGKNAGIEPEVAGLSEDRQVVVVGGEFTGFGSPLAPTPGSIAKLDLRTVAPGVIVAQWEPLNEGPNDAVFAIGVFDDYNPQFDNSASLWDRNDRAASRLAITLSPDAFAFTANAFIRIYDSNFNLIYTNDTIAPPFPDPAGTVDPSRAPGAQSEFIGPEIWGGETYYIEVSNVAGTGRYTLTVQADALPPEGVNNVDAVGDGVYINATESVYFGERVAAGMFEDAQKLTLDPQGDANNFANIAAGAGIPGEINRSFTQRGSGPTVDQAGDFGQIHTITDTDLYFFVAPSNGFVEVRINTTQIADLFREIIDDDPTDATPGTVNLKARTGDAGAADSPLNSWLDSALRIFNNDFEEIAYNNKSLLVNGESSFALATGGFGAREFFIRDAAIIFKVEQGEKYFIQVESGQRDTFFEDPDLVDWRYATGTYELLVNAQPTLTNDDHADTAVQATPIPIDPSTGSIPVNDDLGLDGTARGSIEVRPGILVPQDVDFFKFTPVASGSITVTIDAGVGLSINAIITSQFGVQVAQGLTTVGGLIDLTFDAEKGDPYFIRIASGANNTGDYIITINSPNFSDDHADVGDWINATELELNRFLGVYQASGNIEEAGDTDVFRFDAVQYGIATILIETQSPSLDPFVRIYEIHEDPAGNLQFVQISFNDNGRTDDNISIAPNSRTSFSLTPERPFYIVVGSTDPNAGRGAYTLTIDVPPTDDHPNLSDFPTATNIPTPFDLDTGIASGSVTGNIEVPSDDDLFRFTSPITGNAIVRFERLTGDLDATLTILNSSAQVIIPATTDDPMGSGIIEIIFPVLTSVQYYILVDVFDNMMPGNDTGTYSLDITLDVIDDHADAGEFPLATVITLSPTTGIGSATGVILPVTDTDLFTFTTLAEGEVRITLTTPQSNLNPSIQVFDSMGVLIPGAIDSTEDAQQIIIAGDADEQYFVLVLPSDPAPANPIRFGSYVLQIAGQLPDDSMPGPGPGDDDHANAGQWGIASNITLNQRTGDGSRTGVIEIIGDTDLFTFVTIAAGPVFVQITTPQGGLLNARAVVYNAARVQIAADSAGIPGATASTQVQATAAGQRFFVLVEPVGVTTGSYTVRIDSEPPIHYLYYPEGFSGPSINEFVPIVNPNNFPVNYTVIARYEVGERDQVLASGTIEPNTRGGITISQLGTSPVGVRIGTPYALEIQSDGQLGATLSHYDFNITTGENFTNRISTTWTFAEANRNSSQYRDFLVFYNPNDQDTDYTVTLYYTDGTVASFTRNLEALRRGGINFNTDLAIPANGAFGVRIDSDLPIVASLTSFDIAGRFGYAVLGDPDAGSTAGVIPSVSTGDGVDSRISLFNPSNANVTVTLRANYARVDIPDLVRTISVNANSRRTISLNELGLLQNQIAGLTYQSNAPITVQVIELQRGEANATLAGTEAAQIGIVGDAFIGTARAGITYFEELSLYNPGSLPTTITINFLFNDGTTATRNVNVAGRDFAFIAIHEAPEVLSRGGPQFFSLSITAPVPFVGGFNHYDLFLGGGWGTLLAPVGLTNPLSTIL